MILNVTLIIPNDSFNHEALSLNLVFSMLNSKLEAVLIVCELVVEPLTVEDASLLVDIFAQAMELAVLVGAGVIASIFKYVSTVAIRLIVAAQTLIDPAALICHSDYAACHVSVPNKLPFERAYVVNNRFDLQIGI